MEASWCLSWALVVEAATVGFDHSFGRMLTVFNVVAFARAAVVVLFLGVSLLMLGVGIFRRTRLDHVRMSWGTGKLFGLPLSPTLFLAVVLVLVVYGIATGRRLLFIDWFSGSVYVGAGLCWYLGALLSASTIVTDSGLSCRFRGRQVTLSWHEITDYVVTLNRRSSRYVFFRVDAQGFKRRVEVFVPSGVKDRFQSIVEFRLDDRFDRSIQRPMGQRALEQ
jgi:hypothetical protein